VQQAITAWTLITRSSVRPWGESTPFEVTMRGMTNFMRILGTAVLIGVSMVAVPAIARDATISIHADQVIKPTTNCLAGVCIEDVNHEIYGGLYSQMIFGESFQEPPSAPVIKGFRQYGGTWESRDQVLQIDGADGPKLVSDHAPFANGTIRVELQFADKTGENAGLLFRIAKSGVGADALDGYEVALDPSRQIVRLARHQGDFKLIADTPCNVPVGRWIALAIKLNGSQIEIFVDGKSALQHDDRNDALAQGTIGLRAWHSKASFRNLSVETTQGREALPFEQAKELGDLSGMWQPVVRDSAIGHYHLDTDHRFLGSRSQQIFFDSGNGEFGIENRGLNRQGLNFVAGKPYEGCVWVRAEQATTLFAGLDSADGSQVYAEQSLPVAAGDWQRFDLSLTPTVDEKNGRFSLKLKQARSIGVGYVFLEPGDWGRFKGLPVRRDVAEGMINQGVSVIRYGGSMVNSPAYKWKNMIGPRDRRSSYEGTWYRYSSNGWGAIDFLNFAEAAGVFGVPDLNVNETPQDMADFIEYVNGPADSEWGQKRVADGHPAPYRLRYLELGNEEHVNAEYAGKFKAIAEAIWSKDPDIILVVGDFAYRHKITDPDHISGADGRITSLDGQRQILDFAKEHDREVWFDVHVWSESLSPSPYLVALPSYIDAIDKLANGARHKVVVFELNANSHGQNRALANALAINTIRRDNRMPIVTSANGLQPDGQNDNGWDQGLLFLNPRQVWLQPPGYVTQMQSRDIQPELVRCDVAAGKGSGLDATAGCSKDRKTLVLQVVNTGDTEGAAIELGGFTPATATAHITELASSNDTVNTADATLRICPKETDWNPALKDGKTTHVFPAHSFTIIRFQ
jgi:hypothetical protein